MKSPQQQHTPGPWRVASVSNYKGAALNIDADTRGYICEAGRRGDREAEANARLIAAAPDLLTLVRDALSMAEREFDQDAAPVTETEAASWIRRAHDLLDATEARRRSAAPSKKRSP